MAKVPRYQANQVGYTPAKAVMAPMELADMSSWTRSLDAAADYSMDKYTKRRAAEEENALRTFGDGLETMVHDSKNELEHRSPADEEGNPISYDRYADYASTKFDGDLVGLMADTAMVGTGQLTDENYERLDSLIASARGRLGRQANTISSQKLSGALASRFISDERSFKRSVLDGTNPIESFKRLDKFYALSHKKNQELGFMKPDVLAARAFSGMDEAVKDAKDNLADMYSNDALGLGNGSASRGMPNFTEWMTEVKAGEWDQLVRGSSGETRDSLIRDVHSSYSTGVSQQLKLDRIEAKHELSKRIGELMKLKSSGTTIRSEHVNPIFNELFGLNGHVSKHGLQGQDLLAMSNKLMGLVDDPSKPSVAQERGYNNLKLWVGRQFMGRERVTIAEILVEMQEHPAELAQEGVSRLSSLHWSQKTDLLDYINKLGSPVGQQIGGAVDWVYSQFKTHVSKKVGEEGGVRGALLDALGTPGSADFPELSGLELPASSYAVIERALIEYTRDYPTKSLGEAKSAVFTELARQIIKGEFTDVTKINIDPRTYEQAVFREATGQDLNYRDQIALGMYAVKTRRLTTLQEVAKVRGWIKTKADITSLIDAKPKINADKVDRMKRRIAELIEPIHFGLADAQDRAKNKAADWHLKNKLASEQKEMVIEDDMVKLKKKEGSPLHPKDSTDPASYKKAVESMEFSKKEISKAREMGLIKSAPTQDELNEAAAKETKAEGGWEDPDDVVDKGKKPILKKSTSKGKYRYADEYNALNEANRKKRDEYMAKYDYFKHGKDFKAYSQKGDELHPTNRVLEAVFAKKYGANWNK